jgi:hypothetical protein
LWRAVRGDVADGRGLCAQASNASGRWIETERTLPPVIESRQHDGPPSRSVGRWVGYIIRRLDAPVVPCSTTHTRCADARHRGSDRGRHGRCRERCQSDLGVLPTGRAARRRGTSRPQLLRTFASLYYKLTVGRQGLGKQPLSQGGDMWVLGRGRFGPDVEDIASQAFSRSWHFIERDPVLAGHDREALQAELALRIRQALATTPSTSDPVQIANRAISSVREEMQRRERRALAVDLVS